MIDTLARFAVGLRLEDVPTEIRRRACWILADTVGCIVAGHRARELRRLPTGGTGEASCLGTPIMLPRAEAALRNGMAATWLDLDEGNLHTKGHAGVQVVPALLAEAQATGRSGAAVLRALIAAYEIGCRVYGAADIRLAVHPHGTYGPMAAAIALGCLRGLDADAMAAALSIGAGLALAASRATLADGATLRNAYTGLSARNGFLALELAAAGFTGERDPFTSVFGDILGTHFAPVTCLEGLGTVWRLGRNYFKLHPSARYVHSAIDLADTLRPRLGPNPAEAIAAIRFDGYAMAATMASPEAATPFGTRFSIPLALAGRLLDAEGRLDDDGSALLARADVRALAARVTVREVPDFTAAYPAQQPCRMDIHLRDGRVLSAEARYIPGEAERPHAEAALRRKFTDLATPCWGEAAPAALDSLLDVVALPDIGAEIARWRDAAKRQEHAPS